MKTLLIGLVAIALVGTGAGVFGYYSHKYRIEPIYDLGERADIKGRRMLGLPTQTEGQAARIETIYLTLNGTTYAMPNNDFKNGGALSVWGDDILVMHGHGRLHYFEPGEGLVLSDVVVPDSGRRAYAALAQQEFPGRWTRADAIRHNDVQYIDTGTERALLVSYTYVDTENVCYRSRISRLTIPDGIEDIRALSAGPEDWDLVYETNPCLPFNETRELIVGYMAGGRMAFKAPNLLYYGSGEYHLEGFYRPDSGIQSDASDYGKTLEINLETGETRHYSKGHRNLQGVVLDAQGRLWTTEHGMRGGDELNLVLDGENYGWPLENLGTLYSGLPAPTEGEVGRHELYRAPVFSWLPSAAVSSLALVEGFHPTWDGDLLIGSLKGRTMFRARIQDERLVFLETIEVGQRIRDIEQVDDERIALWLDTNELIIFQIEPRKDPLEGLVAGLTESGMAPQQAEAVHGILQGCNECHAYEEHIHGAGPSLYALYERPVAGTAFGQYSSALKNLSGSWDRDRLTAYITDPDSLATGTTMSGMGLGNPELADAVVDAFVWLKPDA